VEELTGKFKAEEAKRKELENRVKQLSNESQSTKTEKAEEKPTSVCLFVYLFIYLSLCLFICLFVHSFIHSVSQSVVSLLSIHPSIYLVKNYYYFALAQETTRYKYK